MGRDGQPPPPGHSPPVDTHPRPWARSPTPPRSLSPGPLSPAKGGLSRGPGHRKAVLWLLANTSPFLPQPHCPGSRMRGCRWEAELTRACCLAPCLYEVTYSPSAGPASHLTTPPIIESHLRPLCGASSPPHRPSLNIKPLTAPPRARHVSHWGSGHQAACVLGPGCSDLLDAHSGAGLSEVPLPFCSVASSSWWGFTRLPDPAQPVSRLCPLVWAPLGRLLCPCKGAG